MMDYEYIAEQHQYGGCQAKIDGLQAENDQLRARLHGDEQTIGELRERVERLTAENKAVTDAITLTGFAGIYDTFLDPADAIKQMVTYIRESQDVRGNLYDRIRSLEAQLAEARAALGATADALDGLYGADRGEPIPIDGLTPDRKAAFNRALELVHGVLNGGDTAVYQQQPATAGESAGSEVE